MKRFIPLLVISSFAVAKAVLHSIGSMFENPCFASFFAIIARRFKLVESPMTTRSPSRTMVA